MSDEHRPQAIGGPVRCSVCDEQIPAADLLLQKNNGYPVCRRFECQRWLQQNFRLSATSIIARGIALLAAPFIPKVLIGHMILAVAKKPQSP